MLEHRFTGEWLVFLVGGPDSGAYEEDSSGFGAVQSRAGG